MSLFTHIARRFGAHRMLRVISLYPPFVGAGIRVVAVDEHVRDIVVEMGLTRWNQNYVGTQFGGSLYSMCDPFYMLMLIENLGRDYVVWDKSARIEFLRPGRGAVRARFVLDESRLDEIRHEVKSSGRARPTFEVEIRDARTDELIARVHKELSVRRKADARV